MSGDTDVIVPVHGKYELTNRCLRSLASQTEPHRVIVVDDASPDDTVIRLQSEWPAVSVVTLNTNRGYTRAVNAGVAAGHGEYVMLLNNDAAVDKEFLAHALTPLREDPRVGSVATTMLSVGRTRIEAMGMAVDPTLAGFGRLRGRPAADAAAPLPLLAGPDGNGGAFRRVAWEAAGGFDDRMVAYLEVVDLALRLQLNGWRTVAAPAAVGVHMGSGTYGARSAHARQLAGFSRGYMLRRWRILCTRVAPRALAAEVIAVAADIATSRDAAALRGRIAGWRAARGLPPHAPVPTVAIDQRITFRRSLAMRRTDLP